MTATLYIDTAVGGQWQYRAPNTDASQPHLIRLALLLVGDQTHEIALCRLVWPAPGWEVTPRASEMNGITRERAADDGFPLSDVMVNLEALIARADRVVAYNMDFHWRVLERSSAESGIDLPASAERICAMRECTSVVKKPRNQPGGGFAWPKQAEAYQFFTGLELPPLNIDPVERGLALVRGVRAIHEGTLEHRQHRTGAM